MTVRVCVLLKRVDLLPGFWLIGRPLLNFTLLPAVKHETEKMLLCIRLLDSCLGPTLNLRLLPFFIRMQISELDFFGLIRFLICHLFTFFRVSDQREITV